jgi:hypothetical protein
VKQPEGILRERVRCSSLVDWPVYPRFKRTMPLAVLARNSQAQIVKIGLGAFSAVLTAICCALWEGLSCCSSTAQETSTLARVGARMSARVSEPSRGMDDKMAGGTLRSSESLTAAHEPTAIFSMA